MDKNGYDTSRKIVTKEPYRGYHIIKTTSKKHHWSDISKKFLARFPRDFSWIRARFSRDFLFYSATFSRDFLLQR